MIEMVVFALALSIDAFAIALCIGMCANKNNNKLKVKVAATFGFFQGFMCLIGFYFTYSFKSYIETYDHWIALILLGYLGINMIRSGMNNESEELDLSTNKNILINGVATSIDALAVGITLAALSKPILEYALVIGVVTFILSYLGTQIGSKLPSVMSKYSLYIGGVILIIIGIKIFAEHTLI